jgi:hypothetical protein
LRGAGALAFDACAEASTVARSGSMTVTGKQARRRLGRGLGKLSQLLAAPFEQEVRVEQVVQRNLGHRGAGDQAQLGQDETTLAQIEESIARYLTAMDTADRSEPDVAQLKKDRLQETEATGSKELTPGCPASRTSAATCPSCS